jgi:hypothetical protein
MILKSLRRLFPLMADGNRIASSGMGKVHYQVVMEALPMTDRERNMAKICESCPICRHARRKQQGMAFRVVKTIENRICPFCQAYEKVHERKAHEPVKNK